MTTFGYLFCWLVGGLLIAFGIANYLAASMASRPVRLKDLRYGNIAGLAGIAVILAMLFWPGNAHAATRWRCASSVRVPLSFAKACPRVMR